MISTGFPDLLSHQRQARVNNTLKSQLETTAIEAVTGRYQDVTKALNGQIGEAFLIQKALDDIEQSDRINTLTASRLSLTTGALGSIREGTDGIGTSAIIALTTNDSFSLETLAYKAENDLRNTMSLLNSGQGQRRLFAGDDVLATPLASPDILLDDVKAILQANPNAADAQTALDTYFNDPAGGFATNIYQGGDGNAASSYLYDGTKIDYSVRADHQALKDTMRGLAVLAVADSVHDIDTDAFADIFTHGANSVNKGESNLIKLEGLIGVNEGQIEKAVAHQNNEKLTLGIALNDLVGRDQYEAVTSLQLLQTQLESSYLITTRLSNLSLTNYL